MFQFVATHLNVFKYSNWGFNQLLQSSLVEFVQQQLSEPPVSVTEAFLQPCRLNRWD